MKTVSASSCEQGTTGSRTYRIYGIRLASDFPFASPLPVDAGQPDLTFMVCRGAFDVRGMDLAYESPLRNRTDESVLRIYGNVELGVLRFPEVGDFVIRPDRIECYAVESADVAAIEIRFIGPVLAYWLELRGTPAVHGSALDFDGRAALFLAENGGGKSSLAAACVRSGMRLIADDIAVLARSGERICVMPGYPQMRMWPELANRYVRGWKELPWVHPRCEKYRVPIGLGGFGAFCNTPRPVAAVFFLDRRSDTELSDAVIHTIPPSEALVGLIAHSFVARPVAAMGLQPQRLRFLSDLVGSVPVRRLSYPGGFERLLSVVDVVRSDLAASI